MFGLALRKQCRQFLARQPRPMAHAPGIHMHEWQPGFRIIADTAGLTHQRGISQLLDGNIGEMNIGRLAQYMLAVSRLPAAAPSERLIGLLRAVGGDEMDGLLRADLLVDSPDCIDQLRVHAGWLISAPVAHDAVDPRHGFGHELAIALVSAGHGFLGVDVVESQGPAGLRGLRAPGNTGNGHTHDHRRQRPHRV